MRVSPSGRLTLQTNHQVLNAIRILQLTVQTTVANTTFKAAWVIVFTDCW